MTSFYQASFAELDHRWLNGKQGTELADVIVNKIKQAVNVGRENVGEARLVAGIVSGLAGPKTV